ncbi:cysteine desulfurase family protein [Hydrogenivirga sp. 128-5-R1-1]|uniref:cysteine desulfurase family protein n=1 Tax=Hydrogenivirga sp. 128-5-R1-1 TaxID=392423 RepID=UPI00015EF98D|nr:cysteine desulfurase family protein [Hydrogenivirga sp. 128-5-R1-1]EDP75147.1 FeS cluster formation protein NifS [Hydrogenivirga sp. 128-5-R1-1]
MRRIYLDNAATTPLLPEVKDFICRSIEVFGNPSSPHRVGEEARELLELARENVASLLGVSPPEIIFNSCATEGNNSVFISLSFTGRRGNVVISSIEHKSVSAVARELGRNGIVVREAIVNREGVVELEHLESLIDGDTLLVSVMSVSNEFGTVQPVREIAKLCREKGTPLHTDAVQAVGKVKLSLEGVGYATFSGHKFHAPKGVGFMYIKEGIFFKPLLVGGGQEFGYRSGTENLHGILAMAKALELIYEDFEKNTERLRHMRDTFERLLEERVPGVRIVGKHAKRNPSISAVIFPGKTGWEIVESLSQEGLFCSSGSACSSGEVIPNEHLLKMGYSEEEATRMVRFSFGLLNNEEEVYEAVERVARVL